VPDRPTTAYLAARDVEGHVRRTVRRPSTPAGLTPSACTGTRSRRCESIAEATSVTGGLPHQTLEVGSWVIVPADLDRHMRRQFMNYRLEWAFTAC
jgi:hypothetical protein